MNLIFVGFLPPASANPEERTLVELLSQLFIRTVVFQGIGVRGLDFHHVRSLLSRLRRKHLTNSSSSVTIGLLPVFPIRRGVGARLTAWMIRQRLARLTNGRFQDWVFWTRFPSPELVEAVRGLAFRRVIYEAVDHYAAEPLFSPSERGQIEAAEGALCERATVIAASAGLAKRFQGAAGGCYWLPIGTDSRLNANPPRALAQIARPRLAVVGSLDELVDDRLLYQVAWQHRDWQLLLAGPRDGSWGRRLKPLQNVHWLGPMKPDQARGVIAHCDVALNPCVMNEWTEHALPVKIFDYLAEGKPIVSTPMGELDSFGELIAQASAGQFISAIEGALASDSADAAARRRRAAAAFTQQERARRAFDLIGASPTEVLSQRRA